MYRNSLNGVRVWVEGFMGKHFLASIKAKGARFVASLFVHGGE